MLPDRVNVTNTAQEDDFTQQATCDRVIQTLRGPRDALFYSSPCAGGSPWPRINRAKARRRGCGEGIRRVHGHIFLHHLLWDKFEAVARRGIKVGAMICVEWG
eukprot:2325814-Lingulodinium_polyedra.AAC.1